MVKEILLDLINDRIRKLIDNGDNVRIRGFVVNHSVGGKGSWLGALDVRKNSVIYLDDGTLAMQQYHYIMMLHMVNQKGQLQNHIMVIRIINAINNQWYFTEDSLFRNSSTTFLQYGCRYCKLSCYY